MNTHSMKKMKNCKQVLLCGTLSLCLLGGIPQVVTTATAGTLSAQQEGKKVTGTVTDAMGPVIGAHSGPGTLALFFLGSKR